MTTLHVSNGPRSGVHDIGARTQAALVRSLLDELVRYAPDDPRAAALREQLEDETRRLAQLTEGVGEVA
jgi:hypothetical protein